MSPLTTHTFKAAASYEFIGGAEGWGFIKKGTVNASFSTLEVDYHEFSDLSVGAVIGSEPLYSLGADVVQIFVSFWY